MLKNVLWLAMALAPAFLWGLRAADYTRHVEKKRSRKWRPRVVGMFMFTALVFYAWAATVFCIRLFPTLTGGDRVGAVIIAFGVACIAAIAGMAWRSFARWCRRMYEKMDEWLYIRTP